MPIMDHSSSPQSRIKIRRTDVLIVAAGRGRRFGGTTPKQYCDIGGESVLRRTVRVFLDHPQITRIRVVIHPDDRKLCTDCIGDLHLPAPIEGGPHRQDSVRRGLEALSTDPPDYVLIHDAARPFVTAQTISAVIDGLATAPAALAATPLTDTLKRVVEQQSVETISRDGLWRAQTPQGFHFETILGLHRSAGDALNHQATDDAALAERAGLTVTLVPGGEDNIKITTADDLERIRPGNVHNNVHNTAITTASGLMPADDGSIEWETRIGTGFDVHAFGPGDHVILCGVPIPHEYCLTGHSDADVCLHALTDALLGAIGAGDIGLHFPPDDSQWKNASSDQFLAHAVQLVKDAGGHIVNTDITLICETPKLTPYRKAMTDRVAEILGMTKDRIGIKATTTECLGFTGRREGVAAQAAASVRLPIRKTQNS